MNAKSNAKQSECRAKAMEDLCQNAMLEPINYYIHVQICVFLTILTNHVAKTGCYLTLNCRQKLPPQQSFN